MPGESNERRSIPSVERVMQEPGVRELAGLVPRDIILKEARDLLETLRQGGPSAMLSALGRGDTAPLARAVAERARAAWRPGLVPVVNATGVVLHTNLGRAPLAEEAVRAVAATAGVYSTLEYDPGPGERSNRLRSVSRLLAGLAGAEGALAVNNNAAAVLLAANTLASGREVVVSRGELIEIGDSFRLGEILEKSGAYLVEVGTANRTRREDYEEAIGPRTGLLLKMHRSNFRITGFTSEVELADLAALGRERGVPVLEDLGSGAVADLAAFGVREPRLAERVALGASIVTASGDKLLGGPQAGLIVGRADLVAAMKRNPLFRALRIDKMTLAALETTLRLLLEPETGRARIPVLAMLTRSPGEIAEDAERLAGSIRAAAGGRVRVEVVTAESEVGGGSQPETPIPTRAVSVADARLGADALAARLRAHSRPIVPRIHDGVVLLDPRTLLPGDAEEIAAFFAAFAREGEAAA